VAPPTRNAPKPWRALIGLLVVIVIMVLSITGADTFSPGKWSKDFRVGLGLDLASGTQVTVSAKTLSGGQPSAGDMSTAIDIMISRFNGTGNSGAQIQQISSNQLNVSVPGGLSNETLALALRSAQLFFRPVLLAQPYGITTPAPSSSPSPGASPSPSSSASPHPSASPSAKASSSAKALGGSSPGTKTMARVVRAAASPSASPHPSASASASPSPSASASTPASSASYFGDRAEVNNATYALFQKLKCTPTGSQITSSDSWKKQIGYTTKQYDDPTQQVVSCDDNGTKYVLGPAVVDGKDVTGVTPTLQQNSTYWAVNFTLDGKAAAAFGQVTTKQYNDYYTPYLSSQNYNDLYLSQNGIVLDGDVIAAPASEAAITTGQVQVTGNFSESYAQYLGNVLKFGAVPLAFHLDNTQTISPQLAHSSLDAGLLAAAIGLILVVVYCFIYYRGLGIVSISSLVIAALLAYLSVVLLTKYQKFGLELSGIAGLIVAVGITADSFVVFFERLRDEVRDGKSLRPAVESGWKRARRTILVSDTVSFLAALVLYELAIGEVRGFAYTLGLTTIIDVVVVFLFTKPMVTLLANTTFFGQGHAMSGLDPARLGARTPWRSSIRRQSAGRPSRAAGTSTTRNREA
jgi:preprotein translocase subunit SecD